MFKTYRTFTLTTGVKSKGLAVIASDILIKVLLHKTVVVSCFAGTRVTLDNGGYDTVSTRIVMNRALEQLLRSNTYTFRKKGVTYLSQNGVVQPYRNGMTLKRGPV